MKATTKVIEGITKRGYILENEINLLKNRLNRGDSLVWDLWDIDTPLMISQEQTEKGLNWLTNQWKTPTGKERKNNPLGYWEQDILSKFDHFEFTDFASCGNGWVCFYSPVYKVVDIYGDSFTYYVYGGQMVIC